MSSRRSPQNWWINRSQHPPHLQLLPPAPRMVGPQPMYPLVKPTIVPKPAPAKSAPCVQPRMEKVTSIEKKLLEAETLTLDKKHGHYGYAMKLVERGQFRIVSQGKHSTQFVKVTLRTEAGATLAEAARKQQLYRERTAGKTPLASYSSLKQAAS